MGCVKGYTETSKTCSQTADESYSQCSQTRDEGYSSCDSWGFFSFVCVAWTWVSNIVCVAWTWISNVVCVAWNIATTFVCVLWDVITTIINVIIETLGSILAPILNAIALVIQLIFAIPILGRILSGIWNIITMIISGLASIIDMLAWLIGIRPEKPLMLAVFNQLDERRNPIANDQDMLTAIQRMIDVFREEANVRVLPIKLFYYRTPASDDQHASKDYIVTISQTGTPQRLDARCGGVNAASDLGFEGSDFQNILTLSGFWTNWRRLIGYGAPICAFAVRSFTGSSDGCSNGPLDDYILVNFTGGAADIGIPTNAIAGKSTILSHESGHACNLWHVDPSNLMQSSDPRVTRLATGQILLLRASRHVTYF